MSAIDQYHYKCIGVVHCPTTDSSVLIKRNGSGVEVAIYKLLQDIPNDETDFQGKEGDILLGGGSGEAPVFRISMPEAIYFETDNDEFDIAKIDSYAEIAKAYWSATAAYVLGEGYFELGWRPTIRIESWLTAHVLGFLIKYYPDKYAAYPGPNGLEFDGTICRLLTAEEEKSWNWRDYR